jgi:hypothetical protein
MDILLNFSSYCVLSQGDPLFPLLFVIVLEVLSRMMYVIVDRGLLLRFQWGRAIMRNF